jgi:hypothetical protein
MVSDHLDDGPPSEFCLEFFCGGGLARAFSAVDDKTITLFVPGSEF